jgi:hypothetical protein
MASEAIHQHCDTFFSARNTKELGSLQLHAGKTYQVLLHSYRVECLACAMLAFHPCAAGAESLGEKMKIDP